MDFRIEAARLFKHAAKTWGSERENPVTGARWIAGERCVQKQKQIAARALTAQAVLKWDVGVDLPLTIEQREQMKSGSALDYIASLFGRSLAAMDYRHCDHPRFRQYARGVMASANTPDHVRNDPMLKKEYPPRSLEGLGAGLYWTPCAK